ncbi:prolipoprotein diacylglyceryl transferase [Metaclostridioides mangenotii]|uniref:prolipoprotein diacylglyceryl transferase n=1 Tax=Metaclostridioides mangenotii TaxID=1540 RepID=UPI0026EFF850|nr:prolipoprotein diacylglyceryl transferase [Clostridioides mangenotii]
MDRVAFSLFGIDVMWYGILMAAGMMAAIIIALKESKRVGIDEDDVINIAIIAIPVGLICARVYYVVFNWSDYAGNFMEMINVRGGGLAIHGGLIGGILAGFLYTKFKKMNFFKTADSVMLGMPLAQAIGRWGNYINGEAHGGPTDLPWGIMVDGIKVHPTFLYESVWNLCVFAFLVLTRKKKKYEGQIIVNYIVLYSLGRFFIEGLRTDSLMFGPLRMAQAISLIGIIGGVIAHFYLSNKSKVNKEEKGDN